MVDILKNEDGRQIVKLSEHYSYGTDMTTAALTEESILIDVLRAGKKSKQFSLTADEMDTLVEAWVQFKHTVQVAKELELQQITRLVEIARERIEDLGATSLTIEQSTATDWYTIHYSHRDIWDQYVHARDLNESLTRLIDRITQKGFPLKSDEAPPKPAQSGTIIWTGTVPPNTSSSIVF